jgi:pimeloyl-ACP methyl ester carboxylesterase
MFRTTLIAWALLMLAGPALAQSEPKGDRVEVNGMQVYYEVSGQGEPLVVLHGAYMNIPTMGAIIPKLAETHKVYALEFQGHGRTTDIDRPITYPNLADDVAAFMDAVGIKKADIFGYSMGAGAGLQLAIRHPDKVNKLIAASVAYDAEGWQPEFKAAIPQMTVEMIVNMPFAAEYRKLAANPDGFPALAKKLIALEHEPMKWEADVKALKAPGADHRRRCRCGDARTCNGAVQAAGRRRHGRYGQASGRFAPRRHAGDLAHRGHRPDRVAPWLHRAFPQGRDAEGDVRVTTSLGA